jgi:hypothetical protein
VPGASNASRIGSVRAIREAAVAIDLDSLVVLEDQTVGPDEESLLEKLFPESFYVVGTEGNNLTTVNNLDLFHRVLELMDDETSIDDPAFREEVAGMLEDADALSQEDYDDTVEREGGDGDEDFEDEEEEDWDR